MKTLVLAGTHQREIGFSHPTADLVIQHYGSSINTPDKVFTGIDGAREGRLWTFGDISIAKIIRIGETSEAYLETLSEKDLMRLAKIKETYFKPDIAEVFNSGRQGTSVHSLLIQETKPEIVLDLHSYHEFTENLPGTGGYWICPLKNKLTHLIEQAKIEHPEVYGSTENIDAIEIFRKFSQPRINKKKLIDIILGRATGLEEEINAQKMFAREHNNQWNWGENKNAEENDYCFEAVHWGPEQQRAMAKFITEYLTRL